MKPQYLRILSLSLEFWGFSRLRIRNLKIVEVFWGRGLCFNFEVFWNLPSKIIKLWGEVEGRGFEDEVYILRLKYCQYFEVFLRFFEEFSKTSNHIHNFYYQHFFIHQQKQGWPQLPQSIAENKKNYPDWDLYRVFLWYLGSTQIFFQNISAREFWEIGQFVFSQC